MIANFIEKNKLPNDFKQLVEQNYLPLIERILDRRKDNKKPYFIGVNGCQGSGKSTLSAFVAEYLSQLQQLNVVVMSLDDFYLAQHQRQQVAKHIHPMFSTRGVPGTHDTKKLEQVLLQLTDHRTDISIPTFNKATDEPHDKARWQHIKAPVDIVIVEGWCWGVAAQPPEQLIEPINALEQQYDTKGIWRNYVNKQLAETLQPLYTFIDYWVVLQAPSFACVHRWRLEQEQKLAQSLPLAEQSKVMNAEQILNFIQFFQRLTEHGINTLGDIADTLLLLDENRQVKRCINKEQ